MEESIKREQLDTERFFVRYEDIAAMIRQGRDGREFATPRAPLEQQIGHTRFNFSDQYKKIWSQLHMDGRVDAAVDDAVNQKLDKHWWGAKNYKLSHMDETERNAFSDTINTKLNEPLRQFIKKVEEGFLKEFRKDLVFYYNEAIAANLERYDNPMEASYARQLVEEELHYYGGTLVYQVGADIENPDALGGAVKGSATAAIAPLASTGAGMAISALTTTPGFVASLFGAKATLLGSSLLATWAPTAAAALGPAGIALGGVLTLFNLWKYWGIESEFRAKTKEAFRKYLTETLPQKIWDQMEVNVEQGYYEAAYNLRRDMELARQIITFPEVAQHLEKYSDDAKYHLIKRISTLVRSLGYKNEESVNAFLTDWGKYVCDAGEAQFQRLIPLIRENRVAAKAWLDLAGLYEYFTLMDTLPAETWERFSPTADNLKLLQTASRWAPSTRNSALQQSAQDVDWVCENLKADYCPELFGDVHTPSEIRSEITRLRRIPFKWLRRPWTQIWEFNSVRYGIAVVAALIALRLLAFKFGGIFKIFTRLLSKLL